MNPGLSCRVCVVIVVEAYPAALIGVKAVGGRRARQLGRPSDELSRVAASTTIAPSLYPSSQLVRTDRLGCCCGKTYLPLDFVDADGWRVSSRARWGVSSVPGRRPRSRWRSCGRHQVRHGVRVRVVVVMWLIVLRLPILCV